MAGVRDKPANLRRGIAPIRGGIIDELNELSRVVAKLDPESGIQSGLGTRLARELNRPISILNARVEAQTGRRGPVVIAKQTKKPIERKFQVAADFNDQPITGIGFPEKGSDAINLDYFRRFLNCDWFEKMWDECIEEESNKAAAGTGLIPYFFGYTVHPPNATDTVEGDTFVPILLASTLVPEDTAELTQASYGLTTAGTTPDAHTTLGFNIGLYDSDFNLVTETGVQRTWQDDGTARTGFFAVPLNPPVTLAAGEYFEAIAVNSCLKTFWCIAYNLPVSRIADADRGGTEAVPTPGKHFIIGAYGDFDTDPFGDWVNAFPESLDPELIYLKPDLPIRDWPIPIVLYG